MPTLSDSLYERENPSDHFHGPHVDKPQHVNVFLLLRAPELYSVLHIRSKDSRTERQCDLSWPTGHPSFLCIPGSLWLSRLQVLIAGSYISFHLPTSSSPSLLSIHLSPSLYCCWGLPQPRWWTLHLDLLNIMRFTWDHSSSLSTSLWMVSFPSDISTPLSLVLFQKLAKGTLNPSV